MFHARAAQENGLRLQKLPRSEEHWEGGLLSSLGSLMPVSGLLLGGVAGRTPAHDVSVPAIGNSPKDPRERDQYSFGIRQTLLKYLLHEEVS